MKKPPAKRPPAKKQSKQGDDQQGQIVSVEQSASWSGPLPPPQALVAFDEAVPGLAERIVTAWEGETAHRHEIERRDMRLAAWEVILGRIGALAFVLAALGVTAFTAFIGAHWVATILGGGMIASVVWAFVKVQRQ